MTPEAFSVVAKRQDTPDVWTLELAADRPLRFAPGQFTMLATGGHGEVPISISGDPADPERLVQTVRAIGLATQALCGVQPGDKVQVRGPYGRPWPVEEIEDNDVVVAAGGIGLPPLRPAILHMLARRERYRRLILLYGSRSPAQLVYPGQLETWARDGFEVHVTVDSAGPEWLGHVGVVTRLIGRAGLEPDRTSVLACGPEVMLRFTVSGLHAVGVSPEQIFVSTERNMQCGIGHCGHCQLGPKLVCRDGPVFRYSEIGPWLAVREL